MSEAGTSEQDGRTASTCPILPQSCRASPLGNLGQVPRDLCIISDNCNHLNKTPTQQSTLGLPRDQGGEATSSSSVVFAAVASQGPAGPLGSTQAGRLPQSLWCSGKLLSPHADSSLALQAGRPSGHPSRNRHTQAPGLSLGGCGLSLQHDPLVTPFWKTKGSLRCENNSQSWRGVCGRMPGASFSLLRKKDVDLRQKG